MSRPLLLMLSGGNSVVRPWSPARTTYGNLSQSELGSVGVWWPAMTLSQVMAGASISVIALDHLKRQNSRAHSLIPAGR